MKSRFLVIIALTGLFGSSIALAQDSLGKKNNGNSNSRSNSSNSQNRGNNNRSTPPSRGNGSVGSGTGRTAPPSGNPGMGRSSGGSTGYGSGNSGSRSMPPSRGSGSSTNSGGFGSNRNRNDNGGMRTTPPSHAGSSGTIPGRTNAYLPPQDDPLGKKGGGNKGGGSGSGSGSGSGGGSGSRGSGSTGGVKTDPGPGRGNGNSGGGYGGGSRGQSGGNVDLGKAGSGRTGTGTRSGGDIPLGRPDRVGSRSGNVGYGGDHNLGRGDGHAVTIGQMPIIGSKTRIEHEVNRENRVKVGDNRYRNGYYNSNRGWHDNNFCYPYYGFQYYDGCNYAPSPFYFYYHLPAYVSCTRISIGFLTWTSCSTRYDWRRPVYDRYQSGYDRRADFDYAVDDIERAFESGSMRLMSLLIPTNGRIEIDVEGQNQYSMSSADFYDMMKDLIEGTQTDAYRIQNVYRDGDRGSIEAVHEYTDAWGRTQYVRQTFGLKLGRRGYEICYFRTEG